MATASKKLATDETLALLAKDATLQGTNTTLGFLAKDTTLSSTNTAIASLASDLVDAITAVKSVNGKVGIVVLDSGDILITTAPGSKTVAQVLSELQTAIANTPLTFSASKITGTNDDYLATVTTGTPT